MRFRLNCDPENEGCTTKFSKIGCRCPLVFGKIDNPGRLVRLALATVAGKGHAKAAAVVRRTFDLEPRAVLVCGMLDDRKPES